MGIGRREFLRQFGTAIATAATPSSAIYVTGDQYVNRRLGIAFSKPTAWVFADIQAMADVKEGQLLALDDPGLAQHIFDEAGLPIVTISKYGISKDSDHFTPGITIFLERISPDDAIAVDGSPIDVLDADCQMNEEILRDFRVTSQPMSTSVSKCPSAQYVASFMFEHANMTPTPVRMKTLYIDQLVASYTLRMYDSPHLGSEMTYDYKQFIDSFRLV